MNDLTPHPRARPTVRSVGQSALLVGLAIFGLLWTLQIPIREIYVPNEDDIATLADALLLAPGASWQHWFTRGYSQLFDLYPDWPMHGAEATAWNFFRPAYQFLIYLAHFIFGRDWALYLLINCLAVAGMGAVAFKIAQMALGLGTGPSLIAAVLVVVSPPVWESWWISLAFAINPLATVFVAGAFLAVLARRDFLCLVLLFLALLTKENTVWAPLAAAITIVLCPKPEESLRGRTFTAAAMLLPLAVWIGLRFAFFAGIGGTYATVGYTPFADFLKLAFDKLTHLHYLFIDHKMGELSGRGAALMVLDRITAFLIYFLFVLWALRILPEVLKGLRCALNAKRWPTVDAILLVTLWAAIALAFYLALPMPGDRYATSVVVFAWPALVAEVERRGKAIIWLGLAVCGFASLIQSSYRVVELIAIAEPTRNDNYRSMGSVLRQVPHGTRKIYVLSAGSLQEANPEYVRVALGVSAEIVRIVEIVWNCGETSDLVTFDHSTANGDVSLSVTLPRCAYFRFYTDRFNDHIANGRLHRNDTMDYELPEASPIKPTKSWQPRFYLGRRMTVHVRPDGPARFVIEHGGLKGIAWFDIPDPRVGRNTRTRPPSHNEIDGPTY
jgi:hypothetical protein